MWKFAAIFTLAALAGCANTEALRADPNASKQAVCVNASRAKLAGVGRVEAMDLAIERGFIRTQYRDTINASKVAIGMNACEVEAAWGPPHDSDQVVTAAGKAWTYWYRSGGRITGVVRFGTDGLVYMIQ